MNRGEDRPSAGELLAIMLEPGMLERGHPKLSAWARRHLIGEARCPKRHRVVACIRTVHGVWVVWRGNLFGRAWRCDWLDELTDVAALKVWCSPCRSTVWTLDLSDPAHPRLMR